MHSTKRLPFHENQIHENVYPWNILIIWSDSQSLYATKSLQHMNKSVEHCDSLTWEMLTHSNEHAQYKRAFPPFFIIICVHFLDCPAPFYTVHARLSVLWFCGLITGRLAWASGCACPFEQAHVTLFNVHCLARLDCTDWESHSSQVAILKFNYHHMANFNYNILQRLPF